MNTFTTLFACAAAAAGEPLVTDRPDFTESTATVAPGRVQLETGLTFSSQENDELALPEALLRIGLSESIELRLAPPSYAWTEKQNGATDASIGAKFRLALADGHAPDLALIASLELPVGSRGFTGDHAHPGAILAASWELGRGIGLGLNAGLSLNDDGEGDSFTQLSASAAFSFPLTNDVSLFTEWYTVATSGGGDGPQHVFDTGLACLITPDVQLDVRVGVGLNDRAPDWLVGAGLSVRF